MLQPATPYLVSRPAVDQHDSALTRTAAFEVEIAEEPVEGGSAGVGVGAKPEGHVGDAVRVGVELLQVAVGFELRESRGPNLSRADVFAADGETTTTMLATT